MHKRSLLVGLGLGLLLAGFAGLCANTGRWHSWRHNEYVASERGASDSSAVSGEDYRYDGRGYGMYGGHGHHAMWGFFAFPFMLLSCLLPLMLLAFMASMFRRHGRHGWHHRRHHWHHWHQNEGQPPIV